MGAGAFTCWANSLACERFILKQWFSFLNYQSLILPSYIQRMIKIYKKKILFLPCEWKIGILICERFLGSVCTEIPSAGHRDLNGIQVSTPTVWMLSYQGEIARSGESPSWTANLSLLSSPSLVVLSPWSHSVLPPRFIPSLLFSVSW